MKQVNITKLINLVDLKTGIFQNTVSVKVREGSVKLNMKGKKCMFKNTASMKGP